ncbi:hypothetical protein HTV45_13155 [Streptomyces sp. CHD11]|uniref:hypothetical protein n=1 Tax=Streptomyces sp. CHD11 TaxID=2741325 RepID=UPI001BFC3035|nr:hypothetical protein [Streptomyces sp. CHD11]MBT3151821.1 hypothetical protein [Streptomyces sp. CHD11]
MLLIVLAGVLVVVIGGCACVVRASRGGPRWARGVAVATLAAGELVRKSRPRGNGGSSGAEMSGDG